MKVQVCECNRLLIAGVWVKCRDVIHELREQSVEMEVVNCEVCKEDALLGAEAGVPHIAVEIQHQ